jgi:diacylglycerol kinase (ATP)
MNMKKARIIYNPTSGKEAFKRQLPEVLEKLEKAGYETSCHATTGEGDATRAAEIAIERKYDVVIAAGGDGTIYEVVNGLAGHEFRPKLGIIPVGTTNDFARALRISTKSVLDAADIIAGGLTIPIDIGQMNDRYFINIAGGGRLTELTYDVPSKLKTVLGQLAYYMKGIEMLPSLKATPMRIEYDGKLFEGDAMLFLVANTNSVGGFERLAPDASLNDGMFSLIILKKINLADFVRVVTMAIRGEHINDPSVIYSKANRIKVSSPEKLLLNLDGEFGGLAPAEFVNLYRHFEVFVPEHVHEQQKITDRHLLTIQESERLKDLPEIDQLL